MTSAAEDALKLSRALYRHHRESWFTCRMKYQSPDPEPESDAVRQQQKEYYAQLKGVYDADTEAILSGEERAFIPTSMWDMFAKMPPKVTI